MNILQKKRKKKGERHLFLSIFVEFLATYSPSLKERPRGVEPCDPGEVLHLLPDKAGDVRTEAEAYKVGVVVDGDSHVLIDRPDEGRHLQ